MGFAAIADLLAALASPLAAVAGPLAAVASPPCPPCPPCFSSGRVFLFFFHIYTIVYI